MFVYYSYYMGYFGKLDERIKVQELRRKGYSYNEILQYVTVSKDTLSRWCSNIPLSVEQQNRLLKNKSLGQRKGSLIAAEKKREERIFRTNAIMNKAKKEVGKLNKRERFIAGLAYYSAEGDKSESKSGFANSDPKVICFMINWFKEFCNIPESKFRGALWLHEGLNDYQARRFWSKITGIPLEQFYKTYIAKNKQDSKKVRKNLHLYGVFSIRFCDVNIQRKILGWISGLFDAKIGTAL